jgi:GTP cyclohydrolase FolE2
MTQSIERVFLERYEFHSRPDSPLERGGMDMSRNWKPIEKTPSTISPLRTTMLSLVVRLLEDTGDEHEAARLARHWIQTGRVILTGNFAGQRLLEHG